MIDYRKLLKKYMEHVVSSEGVFFIPREYNKDFSEEERAELIILSEEIE